MASIYQDRRKGKHAPQTHHYQDPPTAPLVKSDPYYGYQEMATLCARFITHLFNCPQYPPSDTHSQLDLPFFIAYALHRAKLHDSVPIASLILLNRLKNRFPVAGGSSGYSLFISALMISSKMISDDSYSNQSWSIVAQGMFTLRVLNQMEREMCRYLEWEIYVDSKIFYNFRTALKRDFLQSVGPYPTYRPDMVSKRTAREVSSAFRAPLFDPTTYLTSSPSSATPVSRMECHNAKIREPFLSPGFKLAEMYTEMHPQKERMFSKVVHATF